MKAKRIIACIISCILFMVCVPFTVTAKVNEPEVVKTETWWTSYEWNNKVYPFLCVDADIYSDGTVLIYFMFSGIVESSDSVVKVYGLPVPNKPFYQLSGTGGNFWWSDIKYPSNYCPEYYSVTYNSFCDLQDGDYSGYMGNTIRSFYEKTDCWIGGTEKGDVLPNSYLVFRCDAPNVKINSKTKQNYVMRLYPEEVITDTCYFRFLNHDITITPELLSGNIVATPSDDGYKTITYNNGSSTSRIKTDTDVSDIQEHIDKLEAENALLRQENTELKNRINLLATGTYGDVNGDQVVDVQDAQIILAYYTERDVAKKSVPDLVTFGLKFGKE